MRKLVSLLLVLGVTMTYGQERQQVLDTVVAQELQEVVVTSGVITVAKDRKTPIALSTISAAEVQLKVGNLEFPEIMNNTPGVYATKQGGGYGDSRISLRGFDQTNTSKSLLQALKKHRGNSILWLNGDVVFDEKLLSVLLDDIEKNNSFIAVNTLSVADEEVKYTLKDGFVNELSKEVKNALGEAVGINFISSKDLDIFISQLEKCNANDYFEKGLENGIADDNLKVKAIDISKYNCIEVDFEEDLMNANKIV